MRGLSMALLLLPGLAAAQFTATGDQTVTGQLGAGTAVPQGRLEVKLAAEDAYALRVSSQDGAPLLVVDRFGKVGIGTGVPQALLDTAGSDAAGDVGLQLRSGNSSSTYSSSQVVFAYDSSGTYRHSLRTRHAADQHFGNSMDFFIWRSTGTPLALGELGALSLQVRSASSATVHVRPSTGTPAYELVVSDGYTLGAGRVMAATVGPHSSRELKNIEGYLAEYDEARAYDEAKGLRHATYRYKNQPLTRGLIYEDAPESLREPRGQSIVFEARLNNMEMALKVARRRITGLEGKISALEREEGR
ncbi:MAG: hypothetical protein SF051_05255 [Elusimicrobiota bacterium]|nr:hypothetical protein [Elusimicrobiota bacterium]